MSDLVLREFIGGVRDGQFEAVGPDAEKYIQSTGQVIYFGDGEIPAETPNCVYEFEREEKRTIEVTVWVYTIRAQN